MKISKQIEVVEESDVFHLVIRQGKAPFSIRLFLSIFMIIGFVTPVISLAVSFYKDLEIGFSFITTVIIGLLVGFYLLRLILWNTYGKEILSVSADRIDYYCDYRYFRGNRKSLKGGRYYFSPAYTRDEHYGKIKVENDADTFTTQVEIPQTKLLEAIQLLSEKHREV